MDWRKVMNEHFESYEQYPHNPQYSSSEDNITDITEITDKGQKVKNMGEEEYCYEERAAIMEFDGGLSREEAEVLAREAMLADPGPCHSLAAQARQPL